METVCKVLTGSRLYNTHRLDSDFDYRGCYLPSVRDCYQNQIKEVINAGPEEVYYSVHKFLELAVTGQIVPLFQYCQLPTTVVGLYSESTFFVPLLWKDQTSYTE